MKTALFVLSFVAAVSTAHASFELMLVADFAAGSILRYDPTTGTSFGSFGAGQLISPYGVAVNQNKQEAYVSDFTQNRILVFNYNTGEYLREFASPTSIQYAQITVALNGDLLFSDYLFGAAKRVSATSGAVLATYNAPAGGNGTHGILEGAGGEIYVGWGGINQIARYTNAGGNATNLSPATATPLLDAHQAARSGSQALMALGNQNRVLNYTLNGSGATITGEYNYSSIMSRVFGVAMGHGESAYVCGDTATGGAILQINRVTGAVRGQISVGGTPEWTAMAVVVAPEPGSVAAISLGLALVLKRRRRARA